MAKRVYWLSDAEWRRIEPLLPRGRKGARRVGDRRVISGIMYMLKSGARWRDCPEIYGPYRSVSAAAVAMPQQKKEKWGLASRMLGCS
jgi:transposase